MCSADRSGMATSRFLAAAAAGMLLCFAAENRKSNCDGCMTVANGALAAILFNFGNDDVLDPALELQIAAICVAALHRSQWNGRVQVQRC